MIIVIYYFVVGKVKVLFDSYNIRVMIDYDIGNKFLFGVNSRLLSNDMFFGFRIRIYL